MEKKPPSIKYLLLKITQNDIFSFFNSEQLTEFVLGTKNCQITVKGMHLEPYHLKFVFNGNFWTVEDISEAKNVKLGRKSLNKPAKIKEDDTIFIYPPETKRKKNPILTIEVLKKINHKLTSNKLTAFSLTTKNEYIIGRERECDIVADNPQVERKHCKIIFDGIDCFLEDLHTISGTFVNNRKTKKCKLSNYDRISLPGAAYIFYDFKLLQSKSANGIEIEAVGVHKTVSDLRTRKPIDLLDDVSLKILAGEFVAIVGGSGAGKSTLLDCINGVRPCTEGKILYDGNDYYENINSYRGVVGIVPQRDVMHDNLTVEQGLFYTAKLRMRSNLTKEEIAKRVSGAIADVKLNGKENVRISSLSGGQKKRVSIAMELLADPKVIFLDEPTSGLSPDLDMEMMELLNELSRGGRTIVIITHAMDNISCCDRVAFLGRGGRLCFFDKPELIFSHFKQDNFSKIFKLLSNEDKAIAFAAKYRESICTTLDVNYED